MAESVAQVNEVNIRGNTFVTIKEGNDDHLCLLTHKDTVVNISGNTLFIKDPVNQLSNSNRTVNYGSPGVIGVNNGNSFQCNVFNGGSFGSISFSGNRNLNGFSNITCGNNVVVANGKVISGNNVTVVNAVKREECNTEHQIKCDYSHIQRIISNGAMESFIEVPVDSTHCTIKIQGGGGIHVEKQDNLERVTLGLEGNGDIDLSASQIGTLNATLCGNGDVDISECKFIHHAILNLTGNGDVDLGGATIDTVKVDLTGNGDIKNFTVSGDAHISLVGNGDIKCNAAKNALIKKSVAGHGSVKVKRL